MRISVYVVVIAVLASSIGGCGTSEPDAARVATNAQAGQIKMTAASVVVPQPIITYPAYITAYDIQTPEDEFYYHHLKHLCEGSDFSEWPIIRTLVKLG
jgi:hypothetical protein